MWHPIMGRRNGLRATASLSFAGVLVRLGLLVVSLAFAVCAPSFGEAGQVVAPGTPGYSGDGGPGPAAQLYAPRWIALDAKGNLFIGDSSPSYSSYLRRVDAETEIITTVAGGRPAAVGRPGAPPTRMDLNFLRGVALDASGNLYVADEHRVRKVDLRTDTITPVAGTGVARGGGPIGDGGPATSAALERPGAIALDPRGGLFIVDGFRVRRVEFASGKIATAVGTGTQGWSGDGGPAGSAQVEGASGLALDGHGNLLLADHHRIRRIDAVTGIISTIAGTGVPGFSGDGGPAREAQLNRPSGLASDASGNLFIADPGNSRVRRIDAATGIISTVAGSGTQGAAAADGPALAANLKEPCDVAVDRHGYLFIVDAGGHRVYVVDPESGLMSTVAGGGPLPTSGGAFTGDGGRAISARLNDPMAVGLDPAGNVFLADSSNHRIRRVAAGTQRITTVAGTGVPGFSGDGLPASQAQLKDPVAVAADAAGNLFIADWGNHRIRRVDARTKVITTTAGTGVPGLSGDGGPADQAQLNAPFGVSLDAAGSLLIVDWGNHRIRRVDARTGIIMTVAASGGAERAGDAGVAARVRLGEPVAIAVDAGGNLFIADLASHQVRRMDPASGIITTIAGTGAPGYSGDGGPAIRAGLNTPYAIALAKNGDLFIADRDNQRIRKVDGRSGIISTVAGTGVPGFSGDNTRALRSALDSPTGLALDAEGNLLVADCGNHRIRKIILDTGFITTVAGSAVP